MPPLPEGRLENVVASLNAYLVSNLPGGLTAAQVDLGGSGVLEENFDEWLRTDVMFTTPRYSRQVDQQGNMGAEPLIMLNMNLFRKQTVHKKDTYRLVRLADELRNTFRVPLGIAVMDHVENAGANRIGTLQTSEIEAEPLPLDLSKGLYGYNVTSTMRYVFKWEGPS